MNTFSDTLIDHIREVKRTSITIDYNRFDVVIANLKFLYWACLASEQLLIDAADAMHGGPIAEYYRSHLEEERGEVALLVDDLESVGVFADAPDQIAMAMIGTQYYLIKHIHPVSLLGYMAVTEADPTPVSEVEKLETMYGKELFSFMRLHAIKDLDHRKELIDVINHVDDVLGAFISSSAENTLSYLQKAANTWQTMIQI